MAKKQQQINPVSSRELQKALAAAQKIRDEQEDYEEEDEVEDVEEEQAEYDSAAVEEEDSYEEDDYQVEEGESCNSFKHANLVRRGDLVMLRGQPCKVSEFHKSKPGKHGHAKITIKGFNLFTGKKVEAATQSSSKIEVPNAERTDYSVNYIDQDGFVELMHVDTNETKSSFQLRMNEHEDEEGFYALDRVLVKKYEDSLESIEDKRLIATILSYKGCELLVQIKEQK